MSWQSLNWVDWLLMVMIVLSIGISVMRGFAREILSVVIWTLATLNAYLLGDEMATMLSDMLKNPSMRLTIGMALLFAMTLIVGAMLNHVLADLVKKTGLTGTDRILGAFFGLTRGIIVVMALVFYMPDNIQDSTGWHNSKLVPTFQEWEADTRESVQEVGHLISGSLSE